MNEIVTFPARPETITTDKYAALIAELSAVESLFALRFGVTMNCGDVRLIKIDGGYVVQELRRMKNGSAEYRHISTHADIAAAVIAFRRAVLGHSQPAAPVAALGNGGAA